MEKSEIQKFAEEWIAFQAKENPDLEPKRRILDDDPELEIVFRLMRLAGDDWETALAVTAEIANQSNDPWIVEILGAGPLEDILRHSGYRVLPGFLSAAKANPTFRQALQHMWKCTDPDVWEQFLKIRDRLEDPKLPNHDR